MEDQWQRVEVQEKARGRHWQNVGPLTLNFLGSQLKAQFEHLPPLTPQNAREVCALPQTLSLQLCCESSNAIVRTLRV